MLSDLYKVSKFKPVAYETCLSLEKEYGLDLDTLRREFEDSGLRVTMLSDQECMAYGGTFYVYDEQALQAHLEAHKDVLASHEWPCEPAAFITHIASNWAPEKTALFDVVSGAFGDKTHPGRTDVAVPDHDDRYQPAYLDMLRTLEVRRAQTNASHPAKPHFK